MIAEALKEGGLSTVSFEDTNNQVNSDRVSIGFITRQKISQLLENGDISDGSYSRFFDAFFVCASEYLLKWMMIFFHMPL